MLLFVIDKRLVAHARDHQLALLAVVKRRVQRHETVPAFSFRPLISCSREKLFRERKVADVTTTCGTLRQISFSS